MKRVLKIFFISFGSLIGFLAIIISIALWFVFTPKRLTPFVQKQVEKYITCTTEIGDVELTFFSTFPKFGIKINQTKIINPFDGAPCDTLLNTESVTGIINISALFKNKELIINDFRLNNGEICIFTDINGVSNYDIFSLEQNTSKQESSELPFKIIDVENVEFKNIDLFYINNQMNIHADLYGFTAKINGSFKNDDIKGFIEAQPFDLIFHYKLGENSNIITEVYQLSLKIAGNVESNNINGKIVINPSHFAFSYLTDSLDLIVNIEDFNINFLGDLNTDTISGNILMKPFDIILDFNGGKFPNVTTFKLSSLVKIILSRQLLELQDTKLAINGLNLSLNGSIENDTLNKTLLTDLNYNFNLWQIRKIIALIPETFSSYLEGIDVSGLISSKGSIKGNYDANTKPVADISVDIRNGALNYAMIPFPLSEIKGSFKLNTDFKSPSSILKINNLSLKTPQSSIQTEGVITNLFGDIRVDLKTSPSLNLSEFKPIIPDSLKLNLKGIIDGNLKTVFSMSQIKNMELEKMKISGLLTFSNLNVVYDSISLISDKSDLELGLPNNMDSNEKTKFIFAKLFSNHLEAKKINTFNTTLKTVSIDFEASDIRDTTRIPNLLCSFDIGSIMASIDSLGGVFVVNPKGKISIDPRKNNQKQPEIKFIYDGGRIESDLGDISLIVEKIGFDVDIESDPLQKDIVLQWNPRGYINFEKGWIISSIFDYPVEFPAIKMRFDPETFMVEQANLKIEKSDFTLFGQFINVSSYFRGDSILRGNLYFISEMTNIAQIMAMTSGIGSDEKSAKGKVTDEKNNTTISDTVDKETEQGPYLAPRGIDILLQTNINKATYGATVASNIKGNVQVFDGILVLDELSFSTPATDMQVSAIYRTPRKNHLYMGIDLHMLNIEIAELLRIAPDLDTIMPMLHSFSGEAEFHFAFETYTDSLYNFKKSTIRGASSIRGNDLVLMDSKTYRMISKKLLFSKKTQNKVDSLSAEFIIFKDEIDVYPFLIVMDKYKAVIGGRHNIDMSFNYNFSLVESPLPFRLSLDYKGTIENAKPKLQWKSRYPEFYRPPWHRQVENEQLNLRNIIRESLLKSMATEIENE